MTNVEVLDAHPDSRSGYRVDIGRGGRIGRVWSEWFSRPSDERYLSLSELMAAVKGRAERSRTRTVESAAVRVEADRGDGERLGGLGTANLAPAAISAVGATLLTVLTWGPRGWDGLYERVLVFLILAWTARASLLLRAAARNVGVPRP